ncbi:hypothetical protein KBB96_09550 [Luteolibacter ambystomatis]|uniref:Avirulence protein n=1 Tax=Luteolibacter ambystomatis TaxID=2824561 RepID=A0A975PGV8_9BACT|nr:DUF6055 domain-containing protein [Luteolibacter ambystomatis]QUE53124.1 hypothetical protein KBB96_09550 [Luteolibacter ambystomatis]
MNSPSRPTSPSRLALALLLAVCPVLSAQTVSTTTPPAGTAPVRELYLPAKIGHVPEGNDWQNPESVFCFKRSKSTEYFAMFWAKEYGDDPMANPDSRQRFNVDEVLKEADRYYDYYVKTLKWFNPATAAAAKYKMLIFVIPDDKSGTAWGGETEGKIGTFWTPATRINKGPYGVVAHELGHSFQSVIRADGAQRFTTGEMSEMTSQYMLWQVLPEWQTFENYHLKAFMKDTHLAFMHPDNQYHTCYPLEYWSFRHGPEFIGRMWREVLKGEDPVMTYKRLTGIDQERFNNEMYDACRRFVTWDLPRIEKVAARYADQHVTSLKPVADGAYQIAAEKVPQNYGYNAIGLKVPAGEAKVAVDFKGLAGAEGFSQEHVDKAGWRYGFLAHKEDGTRVYSGIFSKAEGGATFTVPAGTRNLWLVVMGAPTEHWTHPRAPRGKEGVPYEQWPYQFRLTGTAPVDGIVH